MSRRPLLIVALLLTTALALAAPPTFDLANWRPERWLPVREERFPATVPFVQREGYIENQIAPGHTEEEIVACQEGLGVASMVLREFTAGDFQARSRMAFERKGAPALLLRVQREAEVTGAMYSLVLYHGGLNLWKYDGVKWSKVGATALEVEPGVFHEVRVQARGGQFTCHLNGGEKLVASDPEPLPAGDIGLWSGEGPCRFKSFSVEALKEPAVEAE